jgi:hypothetical protein
MLALLVILVAFPGILFLAGALSLHTFLICAVLAGLLFWIGACISAARSLHSIRQ